MCSQARLEPSLPTMLVEVDAACSWQANATSRWRCADADDAVLVCFATTMTMSLVCHAKRPSKKRSSPSVLVVAQDLLRPNNNYTRHARKTQHRGGDAGDVRTQTDAGDEKAQRGPASPTSLTPCVLLSAKYAQQCQTSCGPHLRDPASLAPVRAQGNLRRARPP